MSPTRTRAPLPPGAQLASATGNPTWNTNALASPQPAAPPVTPPAPASMGNQLVGGAMPPPQQTPAPPVAAAPPPPPPLPHAGSGSMADSGAQIAGAALTPGAVAKHMQQQMQLVHILSPLVRQEQTPTMAQVIAAGTAAVKRRDATTPEVAAFLGGLPKDPKKLRGALAAKMSDALMAACHLGAMLGVG